VTKWTPACAVVMRLHHSENGHTTLPVRPDVQNAIAIVQQTVKSTIQTGINNSLLVTGPHGSGKTLVRMSLVSFTISCCFGVLQVDISLGVVALATCIACARVQTVVQNMQRQQNHHERRHDKMRSRLRAAMLFHRSFKMPLCAQAVQRAVRAAVRESNPDPSRINTAVVKLTGVLHWEERHALKYIARQLCTAFKLDFVPGASFEENLSFFRAVLTSVSKCARVT
jgi:hypothetical protein